MTTDMHADAATRILTDAIRQLHELARAADDMDEARDTRERLTNDRIDKARLTLIAADMPDWEVLLLSSETLQELAEKRMAELAELRQKLVELESLTSQPMPDYAARIERALEALNNGLPVRDILTEGFDS
jgi:hypothetical protein